MSGDGPKKYLLGTTTFKGNTTIKDGELEDLIPQKPNRRFLGLPIFPYLALYQAAEVTYSKEEQQRKLTALTQEYQQKTTEYQNSPRQLKKIQRQFGRKIARTKRRVEEGNDFMRILGEPPVYFSQEDLLKNTEKVRGYLFNNGFFENKVTYAIDTSFKRIRTSYIIRENRPTLLRDVRYSIADPRVDSLVEKDKDKSVLKRGSATRVPRSRRSEYDWKRCCAIMATTDFRGSTFRIWLTTPSRPHKRTVCINKWMCCCGWKTPVGRVPSRCTRCSRCSSRYCRREVYQIPYSKKTPPRSKESAIFSPKKDSRPVS